ncbi:hypothetical protein ACLOJK_031645 [Asimina triloba]
MAAKQLHYSTSLLSLLFSLAFITAFAASSEASYEVEKKSVESAVEGVVYCQSCAHVGTRSLMDARPMKSAKVGVACKGYKGRVSFYKAYETDPNGYFYAPLDGHKMEHAYFDHPLHCNVPSNLNSGLVGSPLRYEKKRLFREESEAVLYAAGPLAFRPANCPVANHE